MVNNISLCKGQSVIGKLIFCSPEGLINKPLNAKNILKRLQTGCPVFSVSGSAVSKKFLGPVDDAITVISFG
jgi:hypothetical protein